MEKLVVNKATLAYADNGAAGTVTLDTINALAHGGIACFDETGALIASGTTGFNEATIWQGNSETGPICMGTIYPREFSYATSAAAAAAVKKMAIGNNVAGGSPTHVLGLNLPATLTTGMVGGIQIVNLSKRHDDSTRYQLFEEVAITGDTATTYMARLIARITASTTKCIASCAAITGAIYTNGVAFVGNALTNFSINGTGILSGADVVGYQEVLVARSAGGPAKGYVAALTGTNVQAYGEGKNTLLMLQDLEKETNVYLGDQGLITARGNKIFKLASRLESGVSYKTVTIHCKAPNNISELIEVTNPLNKWTFALATADSVVSAVLANLNTVLGAASY